MSTVSYIHKFTGPEMDERFDLAETALQPGAPISQLAETPTAKIMTAEERERLGAAERLLAAALQQTLTVAGQAAEQARLQGEQHLDFTAALQSSLTLAAQAAEQARRAEQAPELVGAVQAALTLARQVHDQAGADRPDLVAGLQAALTLAGQASDLAQQALHSPIDIAQDALLEAVALVNQDQDARLGTIEQTAADLEARVDSEALATTAALQSALTLASQAVAQAKEQHASFAAGIQGALQLAGQVAEQARLQGEQHPDFTAALQSSLTLAAQAAEQARQAEQALELVGAVQAALTLIQQVGTHAVAHRPSLVAAVQSALALAGQAAEAVSGGRAVFAGGSMEAPALKIGTAGVYSDAPDTLSVAVAGRELLRLDSAGLTVFGSLIWDDATP